jgi:catechol 2,3-dioxygenase-like lactoylglutathione lyase family enzyme
MAVDLFAGARVRNFQAARPWYDRLLGDEPSFLPHETEAVWTLDEHRHIYIVEDTDDPGRAAITLFVDDLDARVAAIGARGIEPAERETYSNGVRKVTFRDPDGNEIGFGGPPE